MATYIESSGLISIEAENKASAIRRGATGWTQATATASYSGAGYMVANQTNTASSGYATASDELRYSISVTTTGTWYVWLRVYTTSSSANSVNVGIDGTTPSSGYQVQNNTHGSWQWMRSLQAGGNATLSITTAGTHTVNVWARESGLLFDKIVLSTSSAYTPSGTGPAESSTTGGGGGSYTKYVKQSLALWQRSDMAYVSYASNAANIRYYFEVTKTDGTTVYVAGPLAADGRTGTQYSSAAMAQSNELAASDIGNIAAYVVRFPTMLEMQAITLWHRATSGSIPIAEFYSPIVVQADQVRALQLSAISANMGSLTVDSVLTLGPGGVLYGGTGDATSPDTGIKLWLDTSSGVGVMRIMSYNGGVAQAGFNSAGQFVAGGNKVTLDGNGLQLATVAVPDGNIPASVQWRDSAGGLWGKIQTYTTGTPPATIEMSTHAGATGATAIATDSLKIGGQQLIYGGSWASGYAMKVTDTLADFAMPIRCSNGLTVRGTTTDLLNVEMNTGEVQARGGVYVGGRYGTGVGWTMYNDAAWLNATGNRPVRVARDAQLASTVNSRVNLMEWSAKTPAGNQIRLVADLYRMSAGSDWATTGVILQRITDTTGQAYMMLGANGIGVNVLNPQYLLHLATDSAAKPGTSTWTVASDERTKTFHGTYTDGIDLLRGMGRPELFAYNGKYGTPDDGRVYAGWRAQRVQAVEPEMVSSHMHTDDDGTQTDVLTLDLGRRHTAAMHNAVLDLADALETALGRIADLEARLSVLEVR